MCSCNRGYRGSESLAANPQLSGCVWVGGTSEFRIHTWSRILSKVVFAQYCIPSQISIQIATITTVNTDVKRGVTLLVIGLCHAIRALISSDVDQFVLSAALSQQGNSSNYVSLQMRLAGSLCIPYQPCCIGRWLASESIGFWAKQGHVAVTGTPASLVYRRWLPLNQSNCKGQCPPEEEWDIRLWNLREIHNSCSESDFSWSI